jgi:hypothetical protein
MTKYMKTLLMAGTVALTVSSAFAQQTPRTNWYVLHAQDAKCVLASRVGVPEFASPGALEAYERRHGRYLRTDITRDEDDKIIMAEVVAKVESTADGNDTITIVFFPDQTKCAAGLKAMLMTGRVHDPAELR